MKTLNCFQEPDAQLDGLLFTQTSFENNLSHQIFVKQAISEESLNLVFGHRQPSIDVAGKAMFAFQLF
jgi:hypothetical protein